MGNMTLNNKQILDLFEENDFEFHERECSVSSKDFKGTFKFNDKVIHFCGTIDINFSENENEYL